MERRTGIDHSRAREVFEQYLDGYDREDGKVRLKITHTYGVVAQATGPGGEDAPGGGGHASWPGSSPCSTI